MRRGSSRPLVLTTILTQRHLLLAAFRSERCCPRWRRNASICARHRLELTCPCCPGTRRASVAQRPPAACPAPAHRCHQRHATDCCTRPNAYIRATCTHLAPNQLGLDAHCCGVHGAGNVVAAEVYGRRRSALWRDGVASRAIIEKICGVRVRLARGQKRVRRFVLGKVLFVHNAAIVNISHEPTGEGNRFPHATMRPRN